MSREPVTPQDLRAAAAAVKEALSPHLGADWSVGAGALEWNCQDTLGHINEALRFYASNLVVRAPERRPYPWIDSFRGKPEMWLSAAEAGAELLAVVAEATPPDVRAFHPAGMADVEGFLALGCDETLVHAGDIAAGLGVAFESPGDVCTRVIARLFPWVEAVAGESPWDLLLWCNGRTELPTRPRQGPDWWWHCAPLEEWDGSRRVRTEPPPR